MAEGGFDDYDNFETKDLGKYTDEQLKDEYEELIIEHGLLSDKYDGVSERVKVDKLRERLDKLEDERVRRRVLDREEVVRSMPLLETVERAEPGLTANNELNNVSHPLDRPLQLTSELLRKQQELADRMVERVAVGKEENAKLKIDLERRVTQARDRILEQREVERTRGQQELDIDTLQKFKRWARENMFGLSALVISIAGIITTVVVAGRTALMNGSKAVKLAAKAAREAIKKMGPWAVGLANLIHDAMGVGADGLAWLSRNLWVLAMVFVWFMYRRK